MNFYNFNYLGSFIRLPFPIFFADDSVKLNLSSRKKGFPLKPGCRFNVPIESFLFLLFSCLFPYFFFQTNQLAKPNPKKITNRK